MQNARLKNHLHLHFIIFIYGFTAVLGALISIDAIPLVWYRMLIASSVAFLFVKIKKYSLRVPQKTVIKLIIAGVMIALHWMTFFAAIKESNVSITLAMMSAGAFFTAILEPIWYKRKVIWYEIVLGVVVIFGLYIIFNVEGDYINGIVLALISALLIAIFSLLNGKLVQEYRPSVISFYELSSGVVFISIYLLIDNKFTSNFFILKSSDWFYLLVLGVICTAYAFITSIKLLKFISPYTAMLSVNMEPVYGIILAYLILGNSEKMSLGFYVGTIVILCTVIINGILKNIGRRKEATLNK